MITTNHDDLYEALCCQGAATEGYNVCRYYEDHVVNDLRSDRRLISKVHGCIADPSCIILTREQYLTARRDHPSFYSVLDALMLTNTLLFVGCSMDSDPTFSCCSRRRASRHRRSTRIMQSWRIDGTRRSRGFRQRRTI
ncbi:SIR2 family protein [Cellulomonas sp. JH27-2]|nr:SIR2 family protein [Cellulomonas sp. JH27-2]